MTSELRPEYQEADYVKLGGTKMQAEYQRLREWNEFGAAAGPQQEWKSAGAKRTGGANESLITRLGFILSAREGKILSRPVT